MTKRTISLLCLVTSVGVPALAACSATERQAPLPPPVAEGWQAPAPTPTAGTDPTTRPPSLRAGSPTTRMPGAPEPAVPTDEDLPLSSGSPLRTFDIGNRAPWGQLLADDAAVRAAPAKPASAAVAEPASVVKPANPESEGVKPDGAKAGNGQPATPRVPDALAARLSLPALLSVLPPQRSQPDQADEASDSRADDRGRPTRDDARSMQKAVPPTRDANPGKPFEERRPAASESQSAIPLPELGSGATQPDERAREDRPAATGRPGATKRWRLVGLYLPGPAPELGKPSGPGDFQAALRAAMQARPIGSRPEPAELRRWSSELQQAARLAPDARTQAQLRQVGRYVLALSRTEVDKRPALQDKRPAVSRAAADLRTSLPRRFGIDLLG